MAENFVLPEDNFEERLGQVKKHLERSLEDLEKILFYLKIILKNV